MTGSPHAHAGAKVRARLAVLTVSDTRTEADDESGAMLCELLQAAGHDVVDRKILPDDREKVREAVNDWLRRDGCDGVLVNGGTGVSRRDRTYEALAGLLDKKLRGFGELFRMLSYGEIGSAAMLSRAGGGIASGRILFFMPGSTAAVRLAMEKLLIPEIPHLLSEIRKDAERDPAVS